MSAGTLHELSRLLDTPVQFFFDGLGGAAGRRGNKEVAALDPVIRFAGTAEGRKVVMAFERADPKLRRLLAQHIEAIVRLTGR
jgi:hypothetical protein